LLECRKPIKQAPTEPASAALRPDRDMEIFTSRETYHTRQNRMIETITSSHNGQINLGDYFIADENEVAKSYLKYIESLNKVKEYDLDPLADFLTFCKEKQIKVLVLNIPRVDGLNQTKYFQSVVPAIRDKTATFPNAKYLEFPKMDYPLSLFSESIHYNSAGDKQLNTDFKTYIYPEIISYIKNSDKKDKNEK
jgi:hypothetical protein